MHIVMDGFGEVEESTVDIDSMFEIYTIPDWETLHSAIIQRVARVAREGYISINGMWAKEFVHESDPSHKFSVNGGSSPLTQWEEIAKLAFWLHENEEEYEYGPVLATLSNNLWKYFDFDDIEDVKDSMSQEYSGDAAEFARQYMDDTETDLPEWAESYFDYESYGYDLILEMDERKWAGTTYLFHQ